MTNTAIIEVDRRIHDFTKPDWFNWLKNYLEKRIQEPRFPEIDGHTHPLIAIPILMKTIGVPTKAFEDAVIELVTVRFIEAEETYWKTRELVAVLKKAEVSKERIKTNMMIPGARFGYEEAYRNLFGQLPTEVDIPNRMRMYAELGHKIREGLGIKFTEASIRRLLLLE